MDHKLKTLQNGLKLVTVPISNLESATITVWISVGSRFEDKKVQGISHFLEHMAFKGSYKRPFAQEISETLDGMGAEYNAGTAQEWTNFYIKARKELIKNAFDVLADIILNPIIRDEDIERERGVILEEIAMIEDSPQSKVGENFIKLIYEGNPLAWEIAGTKETIKSIRRKDFIDYRKVHYHAKNMLVTVSGGINSSEINQLTSRFFKKLTTGKREKAVKFNDSQSKPGLSIEYKDSEQAHFILGFLSYPWGHKDEYVESVLATILGRGMSSRLYTEIREKRGLAYAVGTSISKHVDTGTIITYAGVDPKFADEAIEVIIDQLYGIANGEYPIKNGELNKAKEYLKGRTALALEDTISVNAFFGQRALFEQKILTLEQVFANVDKVSVDDVVRVAKAVFKKSKLNLAIIGPFKKKDKFAKIIGA